MWMEGGHLTPAGEPGEAWGTKQMQSRSRDSSAPLSLTVGAQEGREGTGTLGESGRSRSFIWLSVMAWILLGQISGQTGNWSARRLAHTCLRGGTRWKPQRIPLMARGYWLGPLKSFQVFVIRVRILPKQSQCLFGKQVTEKAPE